MSDQTGTELGGTATAQEEPRTLGSRLAGIAAYIGQLPRGERAELRRISATRTPPAPFWGIVDRYDVHPAEEDFFVAVIPAMVRCPHVPGRSPGRVLRSAGVSAARVERWLRMTRAGALRETQRIFAQVSDGVDWSRLGPLLYLWDRPDGERQRRHFARSYYRAQPIQPSESANGDE